ncbi:ubiquitin-conjugating enzyme E2 1 [Artemisia annua]|uniref:Ubiquitin-conjugating enzyme E2 1 n=1 Tax=Artemisia annua TaxID=35608 RepID=A0A2U1P6X7_ARTAN|nr:ubiquitin-conjugating enzyme E2 1 [Artemisia annua]
MTDHSERIVRELAFFQADQSLVGIDLWRDDTIPDVNHLCAIIAGPANCPYEGGYFYMRIRLPDKYPFAPPVIKFDTKTCILMIVLDLLRIHHRLFVGHYSLGFELVMVQNMRSDTTVENSSQVVCWTLFWDSNWSWYGLECLGVIIDSETSSFVYLHTWGVRILLFNCLDG